MIVKKLSVQALVFQGEKLGVRLRGGRLRLGFVGLLRQSRGARLMVGSSNGALAL